jgi:glucose-6-phosphate 1-epimerase
MFEPNRRSIFPIALLMLSLCGAASAASQAAETEAPLDGCLRTLHPEAARAGIAAADFARITAGLLRDDSVLAALDHQPEFRTAIWDYLAGLVDDQRVVDGQARLIAHHDLLSAIEQRYRVPAAVVVAVWGVETDYGRIGGQREVLRSLATLACHGRRQTFFRSELYAAARIVRDGDIAANRLRGSWAGAFGQTQFMPSTFQRVAVDFDGDGRRDLIGNVADALASTAHYLVLAKWRAGPRWGLEVQLPQVFDPKLAGRGNKRAIADWQAQGVVAIDGGPLSRVGERAAILLPAGRSGPAFLVGGNFDALYRYNASENYALAIGHLADRIAGGEPLHTPWPTDDPGLSRAQRRELQTLLIARGHDIGTVDGLLGERSRAAIRIEQEALGVPVDGRAGQRLLARLRASTPDAEQPTSTE